jgi:type IV secretory pathway VirB2 component (pilin)
MKSLRGRAGVLAVAVVWATLAALPAAASQGGVALPFNTILSQVAAWMTGPAAMWIGTIALAAAAFVWMFLRHERGADFAFRALLGTSIAIGATTIITTLVGSGALV